MGGNNTDDPSSGGEGKTKGGGGGFFRRHKHKSTSGSSGDNNKAEKRGGGGLFSRGPKSSSPPSRGSSSPLRRIRGAAGQQTTSTNNRGAATPQSSSLIARPHRKINSTSSPINDDISFHSAAETKKDAEKKHGNSSSSSSSSKGSSWLCRTKYFRQMCDAAFENIDLDESGTVDEKELYSGLLLIHLKLGMYAGPAACKPLGRERCSVIFHQMDADNSGCLDKEEFVQVMMLLFSNVLFRVMVQWSMTLMIVPLIAQKVLNGIYATIEYLYHVFITLDEHSTIANRIELTVEAIGAWIYSRMIPDVVLNVAAKAHYYLEKIPDTVWNSIPLTLISTILGILVVPYCILKVDDFFQYLAQRSDAKTKKKKKKSPPPPTKAAKQS